MRHSLRAMWLCSVLLAPLHCAWGGLFDSDEVLDLKLEGPLKTLIKQKRKSKAHRFQLTLNGTSFPVTVSVGGKSRRKVCSFPPLTVYFEQGSHGLPLDPTIPLRITTHCLKAQSSDENLLKEYLAYRIYGLVSPVAYRARLLSITYLDTDKTDSQDTRMGLIVEPEQQLARRLSLSVAHIKGVKRRLLDQKTTALVNVFEYFIGNTDWSMVTSFDESFCCHNGQLLENKTSLFYVPYDFDLSGWVDASYAKPDPSLPIRDVTSRYYTGVCVPDDALHLALGTFTDQRLQIEGLIKNTPSMSESELKRLLRYTDSFFQRIQPIEKAIDNFQKRCI